MINNLYSIESKQVNKLIQWKADWKTRLQAFQQLRTELVSLQSTLSSMNSSNSFMVKSASTSNSGVVAATTSSEASAGTYTIEVNRLASNSIWSANSGFGDKMDAVNDSGSEGEFTYTYMGETRTIKVASGTTLEALKNMINNDAQNPGVKAQLISTGNGVVFQLRGMDTGADASLNIDSTTNLSGISIDDMSAWEVQQGENSQIRVNGWPSSSWLEMPSNSITEIAEGVTFNLRGTGSATVTVEIDTTAMEENVEKFVEAVNSFRTVLLSLTAVDEDKDVLDPDYAESQSEMEIGSTLTGNYGVQLLSSRLKQAIAGQALGFTYRSTVNGTTQGDLFSTLSQLGITTNADKGNANFGLLEINTISGEKGSLTLAEALAADPAAVASLFAAQSEGSSNSEHFTYNSHISGITQAGTYNVSYTTDADGNITSATINGESASIDQDNKQIALYSSQGSNGASGIVLDVQNLTPNSTFTGTVSIKNGKINELLDMMSGSEGLLGENGTLRILEKNYNTIIDNIDKKIAQEDDRLTKWLRTTRLKFSRLEAVLSKYNSINEGLQSQISQLSSSSSS